MTSPESPPPSAPPPPAARDFIRERIAADNASGKYQGRVHTRFPPEPNGYLHVGHAKSICLNFGIARDFAGKCNLRFDDTNPTKEDVEYVDSIQADVRWLGFEWDGLYYASEYFETIYGYAERLIEKGLAYVDEQTADQIRETRGTLTRAGTPSPWRDRPAAESLDLLRRMRAGEFEDGRYVLRAKIDMASPNINMRDPTLYRIRHAHHHRTGDAWCIYPTYDFAHGYSDSQEGITHSICTLEFENHRPLYEWLIDVLGLYKPQQIEFARLNLTYTVMSKRKLLHLVQGKHVRGWDDPRMPTIAGMRRRGFPPEALRLFCERIGVAKNESTVDYALLEHCAREVLNKSAPRVMGVLDPLEVTLTNWPEGQVDELDAVNNPEDPQAGTRKVPFAGRLYIERADFMEDPPKKFFRLAPGREVRLRWGYFIKCEEVVKDADGRVTGLRCTYDPATRGGDAPDGRKVKATLHWVSAAHALPAEVRIYEHLFTREDPDQVSEEEQKAGKDWLSNLNPSSLTVMRGCRVEPSLAGAAPGHRVQFERHGYFAVDPDSASDGLVFNRTVSLKDEWQKLQKKGGAEG